MQGEIIVEPESQFRMFIALVLATKPYRNRILLLSVLAAILAAFYSYTFRPMTYVSEFIALIRPQQVKDDTQSLPSIAPEPLRISDYVLLAKSKSVLTEVADTYNERFASEKESHRLTVDLLRKMCFAEARLELKTAYTVLYHPTLVMRVSASDAEMAKNIASIWVEVAKKEAHNVAFSSKEESLKYFQKEYSSEGLDLENLRNKVTQTKDEGARQLNDLKTKRIETETQYDLETIEVTKQMEDSWDQTIAGKTGEFAIPLMWSRVHAKLQEISSLENSRAAKKQELLVAQARLTQYAGMLQNRPPLTEIGKGKVLWNIDLGGTEGPVSQAALGEKAPEPTPTPDDKKGADNSSAAQPETVTGSVMAEQATSGIKELTVETEGVDPVLLLMTHEYVKAKVLSASLPGEITELDNRIEALRTETKSLQAEVYLKETELRNLKRAQQAALDDLKLKRSTQLETLKRESAMLLEMLGRQRTDEEAKLDRDLQVQTEMTNSLAKGRLEARLLVAHTLEEFEIITEPTFPEKPEELGTLIFSFAVGLGCCALLFSGCMALVLLRQTAAKLAEDSPAAK